MFKLGTKMYTMAIISSLPIIIRKLSAILVAGSVSGEITPADNPPVVITPTASKNESCKDASWVADRWSCCN